MKKLWAFAPLIAFTFVALAAIIVLMNPGERETVSARGLEGEPLPAFALPLLSGEGEAAPAQFAGRPYLLNVFASWCPPCRVEHPLLMQLEAGGVPILGVAYKDRPERTRAFLAELGDPYEAVGMDLEGRYGLEIGIAGAPETFVIGADGRILALHRGPLTEEIIRTRIMPALRAGAAR
ncbi:MAG: DsbE family thiol:disulfide interchange protein [Hyphomonadaceae bacterium]